MQITTEKTTTLDQLDTDFLKLKMESEIIHILLTSVLDTRLSNVRRDYLDNFLTPLQELEVLPFLTGPRDFRPKSVPGPKKLTDRFFERKMLLLYKGLRELEAQLAPFQSLATADPGLLQTLQKDVNWEDWNYRFGSITEKIGDLSLESDE